MALSPAAVLVVFLLWLSFSTGEASSTRRRPRHPSPWRPSPLPRPSPPYSRPPPQPDSMEAQFLLPQNMARGELGIQPLVWDSQLEAYAQDWANKRALYGNCLLEHSDGPYGENIFWGGGKAWSPEEAAEAWVSEKQYYDYNTNSCVGGDCGHYTQIVWKESEKIGCARVTCSDGDVFMTCNYDPPGNYIGERPF